jgi:prephenate dehydratase
MRPSPAPEPDGEAAAVAYLGPEGTFTEEALLASARPGAVRPVATPTIYDTIAALRAGEVAWAIVPMENSLDGSVTVTLDLLAEAESGVAIVGEALLLVRHSLIGPAPVSLAEIDTVLTHPQVPGQCARFLRGELAGARVLATSSTAEAVRTAVAEGRPGQAAIGTLLAARIYGGTLLREDVQDRDDNETRFVWLARTAEQDIEPPLLGRALAGTLKTSLVFWGSGAGSAGWLVRCLDEFARREINLTKIESRPRRERLGNYMFFADLIGHASEQPASSAIAGLRALCEEVRVLGSYRAALRAS